MKHIKPLPIAMILFLLFACSAIAGPIINGGFETGDPTGWHPPDGGSTAHGIHITTFAHYGNYSRYVHLDAQANSRSDFWQDIDISDGNDNLNFYIYGVYA